MLYEFSRVQTDGTQFNDCYPSGIPDGSEVAEVKIEKIT